MDDLISRQDTIEYLVDNVSWFDEDGCETDEDEKRYIIAGLINGVPSAQPEPEEFEWCTDCKEYDQTAHCCHRWTKVIRQTVEEIKAGQRQYDRTGEWNMCYDDDAPQDGVWFCSVCGYARLVDDISPQFFCPQCGARMLNGR